jgi:hypothetical protein
MTKDWSYDEDDPYHPGPCPYCGHVAETGWCEHHVGLCIDELGGMVEGPLLEDDAPRELDSDTEPADAEIDAAFGPRAAFARRVYGDSGFVEPGSLRQLYDVLCEDETDPGTDYVEFEGIQHYWARDPDAFAARLRGLKRELEDGLARLEARGLS